MSKTIRSFVMASGVFVLAACSGGFKEAVGLKSTTPDEFRVISNVPLVVPPEFSLRPPVPGAKGPQEIDVQQQAREILLDKSVKDFDSKESKAEAVFLQKADARDADSNIKKILERENSEDVSAKENEGFLKKISSYTSLNKNKEPVVDAALEKQRLVENKKEGKPLNDGEVPVIKESKAGFLRKIFGL